MAATHSFKIVNQTPICCFLIISSQRSPLNSKPPSFSPNLPTHPNFWAAPILQQFTATTVGHGDVLGSVGEFDKAMELDPRQKAYLWQRGLSLYYLNRFEEGAEQFRLDVAQNPNDTEESIWCFLCEAQLYGVDDARRRFLEVGTDPRPVMRETYRMFRDGSDPEKLVAAFSSARESEYFYASLYAGLYYEAQNKSDEAKIHLVAACKTPYGSRSDDYMASLAMVHCNCRNWSFS